MSKPLVVVVPHRLTKAQAIARIQGGIGQIRTQLAAKVASIEDAWTDDRLDFSVETMGQTVSGHLLVMDESVRLEIVLPWFLAAIADKLRGRIERDGTKLLEKK